MRRLVVSMGISTLDEMRFDTFKAVGTSLKSACDEGQSWYEPYGTSIRRMGVYKYDLKRECTRQTR